MEKNTTIHLGELWHVPVEPALLGRTEDALKVTTRGALAIEDGRIIAHGPEAEVKAKHRHATLVDHGDAVILPGFVDTHVHYPQLDLIASYGTRLLEWLQLYTFPAESRFSDPAHAQAVAGRFLTELHANGTTCAAVYSTVHAASADALFQAAAERGSRLVAGKVSMDRGAPAELLAETAQDLADTERLIKTWHGAEDGRLRYALTPRFALSCTPGLMQALGELGRKYPDVFIQTHHGETPEEVAEAARLFPEAPHYAGIYDSFKLLGERTILGHGIHASDEELALFVKTQTAIAHCPTSNLFLGSGAMPLRRLVEAGVRVALATDVGGGTSLSMLRTMAACYDVQQMHRDAISPVYLLWLATVAGARLLACGEGAGTLEVGAPADFQVIDWRRNRLLAARWASGASAFERLFALIVLGDDRVCAETHVAGRRVH